MGNAVSKAASGPAAFGVDLLTEEQAVEILGVKPWSLRRWRREEGLPFIRLNARSLRYRVRDIEEWLSRRRVAIKG
jgi:predicted site-specific integrase-resolvase